MNPLPVEFGCAPVIVVTVGRCEAVRRISDKVNGVSGPRFVQRLAHYWNCLGRRCRIIVNPCYVYFGLCVFARATASASPPLIQNPTTPKVPFLAAGSLSATASIALTSEMNWAVPNISAAIEGGYAVVRRR